MEVGWNNFFWCKDYGIILIETTITKNGCLEFQEYGLIYITRNRSFNRHSIAPGFPVRQTPGARAPLFEAFTRSLQTKFCRDEDSQWWWGLIRLRNKTSMLNIVHIVTVIVDVYWYKYILFQ